MQNAQILRNFDLDTIRKARARKAASGGVDLVEGINQISPSIERLKSGETVKLEIPGGKDNLRKFVMSITAKLNNLTPAGGHWEGRTFDVVSDGEANVYVQRGNDLKGAAIPVRKRRGGGGRKPATAAAPATGAAAGTAVADGGAVVQEHA